MKEVTVQLTLEWKFNKKEWSEEKEHVKRLLEEPKIVLGYDVLSSLFFLNEIAYPEVKEMKVIG